MGEMMKLVRRAMLALALAFVAACSGESSAPSEAKSAALPDPVQALTAMYESMNTETPAYIPFTSEIDAAITRAEALPAYQDIAFFSFDPYTGSQDMVAPSNIAATREGEAEAERAIVRVRYVNMERQREHLYELRAEDGAWRIADITDVTAGWNLRQSLIADGVLTQ
jgi:hypothetical protein